MSDVVITIYEELPWDSDRAILVGKQGGSLGDEERYFTVSNLQRTTVDGDPARALLEFLAVMMGQCDAIDTDSTEETFIWHCDRDGVPTKAMPIGNRQPWNGMTIEDALKELSENDGV